MSPSPFKERGRLGLKGFHPFKLPLDKGKGKELFLEGLRSSNTPP